MTDATIVVIVAAIAPTIAAIGAVIIGVRTSRKADVVIAKTAEIHELANSNLTKMTDALAAANEKILGLEKRIALWMSTRQAG